MSFGKIFRYNCKFADGLTRVWRVVAESKESADIKLNEFVNRCAVDGMDVPTDIECVTQEDNIILY